MSEYVSYQEITLSGSIKPCVKLNGHISQNVHLSGCMKQDVKLIGKIFIQHGNLEGFIRSAGSLFGLIKSAGTLSGFLTRPVGYDDYRGKYEIIPKIDPQNIQTADKHLSKDITILAIPYYEVSNPYGGNTVSIG